MRLLLDTHAFLWWALGNERLGRAAREAIEDQTNAVFVSAASAWEITTKHRIGKLPEADWLARDVARAIARAEFAELAISVAHAARAGRLPEHHRDPFDRMLIAQAQAEDLVLVSNEMLFDSYGVRRLW